jgi:hypothetical protein
MDTTCTYCGEATVTSPDADAPACAACQARYAVVAEEARRTRGGYGVADEAEVARIALAAIRASGAYHQHQPALVADLDAGLVRSYALGYVPCGRCGTPLLAAAPGGMDYTPEHVHYVSVEDWQSDTAWLCTPTGRVVGQAAIVAYDAAQQGGLT